ncbi:MAG: TPM domain-containing protein [Leptospiraceae bacterium]|nr:TPM domain-containing protein [Leptospiraceae bacterium]
MRSSVAIFFILAAVVFSLSIGIFFFIDSGNSAVQAVPATATDSSVPDLIAPVTDRAGLLSSSEVAELDRLLGTLQRDTAAQVAILIVPRLPEGETIDSFAEKVFRSEKLGRKGIDDGVLIVQSVEDRKIRIEVGYGLEGALPDARASQIIRQIMVPEFKAGRFFDGYKKALDLVGRAIRSESLPGLDESANASSASTDGDGEFYWLPGFLLAILTLVMVILALALEFVSGAVMAIVNVCIQIPMFMAQTVLQSEPIWHWGIPVFILIANIFYLVRIIRSQSPRLANGGGHGAGSYSGGTDTWSSSSNDTSYTSASYSSSDSSYSSSSDSSSSDYSGGGGESGGGGASSDY